MVGSQLCHLFNRYKSSRQFESRQRPFSSPPARFCQLAAVLRHAHREVGVTVPAEVSVREGQAKGLTYARDQEPRDCSGSTSDFPTMSGPAADPNRT
jgi:hypothetical protein